MKIAISAGGGSLDSPFEPRFGRVPGFILYDSESEEAQYIDNTANMDLQQGAGIKTAQSIAEQGTEVLITGKVGPKALRALEQKDIRIVEGSGRTVREALANSGLGLLSSASAGGGGRQGDGTSRESGSGVRRGGRGMGGGGRGRGPGQGGQGKGGGARGRGPDKGGRGMGGGGRGRMGA
jgi:predicted Fe-Mo cluster-binding NifX family protein